MSATQDFVRKQKTGDPLTKLVLRVVADYANWETGICYPAIDRIAEDCECSRSTVSRRLQELHDQGFINLEIRAGRQSVITLIGYAEWFASLPVKTFNRNQAEVASDRHGSLKSVGHGVKSVGHGGHVHGTPEIYNINISNLNKKHDEKDLPENQSVEERVYYVNGQLKLCKDLNEFWLKEFNTQHELDLALLQVSAYIQPNSRSPLEKQLSSQLAQIILRKKQQDQRYLSAKTNSSNGKTKSVPQKNEGADNDWVKKYWERFDRGEFKT